jgi:TRAP-type C4-dicarboxylate transport system permease small subunit
MKRLFSFPALKEVDRFNGMGPRGPIPSIIDVIDRVITWSATLIVVGTLSSLFLAILINVILRYGFNRGIIWAYEIPSILFPWMVIAGAVMAAQANRHIAVELLMNAVSRRIRKYLLILTNIVIMIFCVLVAWAGMPMIDASRESHLAVTGISEAWGYSSLVYGYIMMAVTAATTSYRLWFSQEDEEVPSGVQD